MRWGILHDYFTEFDLDNFPEDAYIDRLRNTFDSRLKLQVWHYCSSSVPVSLHRDTHYEGTPNYMQFLIPNSVNNDPNLCHTTSTIVCNNTIQWKRGSLLWWFSDCEHASGPSKGSRQCWVIQTAVN